MHAYFNRFTLQLTCDQARSASHPGPCDSDVEVHDMKPENRHSQELHKIVTRLNNVFKRGAP
jgi:hypothetical protein